MSDPLTPTRSGPENGGEQSVDRCPIPSSDPPTIKNGPAQPENSHVVPIHRRPDLLGPCADLVNSEWQRSQTARVHSLQKSSPEFPVCLVLLQGRRETERLLGHARLSRVMGQSGSLFLESVVVSKAERGRGYGRTLMEETERYAQSRGFKRLCLTTHDKQRFYAHIGYVTSTPVQSAGAMTTFVPVEMLLKFSRMPSDETSTQKQRRTETDVQIPQANGDSGRGVDSPPSSCLPPAPAPPLLPFIPPPHPAIPPPAPPPPLPQSGAQRVALTLTGTPYKDARGVPIYWMHKDI
ncbi:N-alpha-acetyltransferase 80 [Brachionichthys hirsutus]|uniref:N-alpha-acetyltransferase 80 n=1 Tax=Brachionichthys hirsutus TaxID=412623 RepID=UPI003604BB41